MFHIVTYLYRTVFHTLLNAINFAQLLLIALIIFLIRNIYIYIYIVVHVHVTVIRPEKTEYTSVFLSI